MKKVAMKTNSPLTWLPIPNSADVMSLSFISGNRWDGNRSRRDSFSKVPNRALAAKTRFYGNNWEHFTFGSSPPAICNNRSTSSV